jgi:hypothetical protein
MSILSVLRLKAKSVYESFAICVYALPLLASVCTGIAQTQPMQDNTWQYSVALEKGTERRAYLWIPPRCKHVRGVLIGLQNMLEWPMFEDLEIRAATTASNMAIVWISPGAWPGKLGIPEQPSLRFSPPADAIKGVQRALTKLAHESGYSEIETAPLLVTGHTAASPFVWGMASVLPNRVFAAVPYKGYKVGLTPDEVPTLQVGQEWAGRGPQWGEVWRKEHTAAEMRKKDGALLIGAFADIGSGHFDWHHESADVLAMYRVGSGALFQTGPNTFQVAARSGGLTRQGQPWEPWIMAYQPGDMEYRSADKPAHILIDVRNTQGLSQEIAFRKIPDVDRLERQITLTATSNSGLPVQFYVESGPASVEGNTLHLLAVPPRSRYPVRVIVSAYQWGRVEEHPVQSAGPETQEFFIRR